MYVYLLCNIPQNIRVPALQSTTKCRFTCSAIYHKMYVYLLCNIPQNVRLPVLQYTTKCTLLCSAISNTLDIYHTSTFSSLSYLFDKFTSMVEEIIISAINNSIFTSNF